MPVIANTGATLLIGHESARQRLGLSCRTSSCTTISNGSPHSQVSGASDGPAMLASDAVNQRGACQRLTENLDRRNLIWRDAARRAPFPMAPENSKPAPLRALAHIHKISGVPTVNQSA